jgi:hypothetical protein
MSDRTFRIDLAKFRSGSARVFAGRPRGEEVRRSLQLALREVVDDATIEIVVPVDTYSVTSSFILGLLGDGIRELKEEKFRRVYKFVGRDISAVVDDAVDAVLHVSSPFASRVPVR